MTLQATVKEKKRNKIPPITLFCLLVLPFMIYFGDGLKEGALVGIELSVKNIIPSLFPFFILADLWSSSFEMNRNSFIGGIYQRIFGINGVALPAFILGAVCGFPLGVSLGANLYKRNLISKGELERFSGFANNPSCAFVISGIGAGLYDNVNVGIMLFSSVILSAIAVGILFRDKPFFSKNSTDITRQSYNLVDSIKNAGLNSITISSYIIFFSSLIGLISRLVENPLLLTLVGALLEITNASSLALSLGEAFGPTRLIITSFALGFSGFSVHLQTFALLPKEISKGKYLIMKFCQGIICAFICMLILIVTK